MSKNFEQKFLKIFSKHPRKTVERPVSSGGGGGTRYIKKVGMFVENFEIDPKGRPIWAWLAHFLTPKRG